MDDVEMAKQHFLDWSAKRDKDSQYAAFLEGIAYVLRKDITTRLVAPRGNCICGRPVDHRDACQPQDR